MAPGNEHLAHIIVEETTRLDGIVQEFLDFARPRNHGLQPVALNKLVERVARFMAPELEARSVRFEKKLDPGLPGSGAGPGQIYQVLLNMIINAIRSNAGGGTVTVYRDTGEIELEVSDTGVVMSA